jgi:hypothetical protein
MSLSNVGNHLPTRLHSAISLNSAVLRIGGALYVMLLAVQNVNTLRWWFMYYVVKFIEILLYMLVKSLVCLWHFVHTHCCLGMTVWFSIFMIILYTSDHFVSWLWNSVPYVSFKFYCIKTVTWCVCCIVCRLPVFQRNLLPLKMEAVCSFETLVTLYQTIWHYILESLQLSLQVMLVFTPLLIFCAHLLSFSAIQGQSVHSFCCMSDY